MKRATAPSPSERATGLIPWLAGLSAAAASIHAAVLQEHLAEFALFGVFFALSALYQALWAIALLGWGPSRSLLRWSVLVNGGIVVLWVASRTIGLPLGPDAGTSEAIGAIDVLATIYEVALVAGSLLMLRGVRLHMHVPARLAPFAAALAAGALTLLTFLGIAEGHAVTHSGGGPDHGPHLLLLSAGVIAFASWAALDARANGIPRFSWRLRPKELRTELEPDV
ncbi:MAG: hypothetical protein M3O88_02855 [Actinomycetota bacterium]|nr:hypothetical protein [Actinomycetota bacterium]